MATYTEHYGLHQWEPTDDFLRTDFNTDFGKIDAALGTLAALGAEHLKTVFGSYQGDETANREIRLGVRPRMVFLREKSNTLLNMAYDGGALEGTGTSTPMLSMTDNGFQVHYDIYYVGSEKNVCAPYTNRAGKQYYYAAIY